MPAPHVTPAGATGPAARPGRAGVPLAVYTTLGLGGPAGTFVTAASDAEAVAAVRACDERGEPVLVLGGGSNLVVADQGFGGTVVRMASRGVRFGRGGSGSGAPRTTLTAAAGEEWDSLVQRCVAEGLSGVECLSGIPGLAGATPIQNVGAYGQEVSDTIVSVRAYDRRQRTVAEIPAAACGFGYRTSAFKRSVGSAATGRFVVLAVTFRLVPDPLSQPVRYAELAAALGVAAGDRVPLADARSAVLKLRAGKGMVLDPADPDTRSAGSFFTNPVLSPAELAAVEEAAWATCGPGVRVPRFPAEDGRVKVSAAWLIEHAGFGKGYAPGGQPAGGGARISAKHTLALVNAGGATTASLLALAREIRDGVRATFGVELAAEPVLVGAAF